MQIISGKLSAICTKNKKENCMAWQLCYILCVIPFLQSINQVWDLVSNSSTLESDVWEVSWNDQEISLFWTLFIIRSLQKMCSVLLVKRTLSFTRDALFTLCTLFPFVPALCTWKGLNLPAVGFWIGGCGRLWCCHREGHAPLLSECVMQQPLLWKPGKTLQVDVWKCYPGFVLSVGGWSCRWWVVTFPLRNTWQVSFEQDQCEYYIKVLFLFYCFQL